MSATITEMHPQFLIEDLLASGLTPQDVRARIAGANEKQTTNTGQGVNAYVLPYFDMYGKPLPFYRLKLIDSPDPSIRYKQVATEGNHVYFPIGFWTRLEKANYIIITEGEKKAAKAVKEGFACVGLGGVESWRNRTVKLHKDAQVGQDTKGAVVVKLPAGAEVTEQADTLATGLRELITLAKRRDIPIIICFDTDLDIRELIKFEVQRAAASLGFELRNRGIRFTNIRQLILKPEEIALTGKLGLDDFLVHPDLGADALGQQIYDLLEMRSAFPKHPNAREYVNKKLQRSSIARSEMAALSTAIICDLDANGMRLHCPDDDNMYYFDEGTHRLMKVHFTQHMEFAKTSFGRKIYDAYGITQADQRLIAVLNSQFCGEEPLSEVHPEKVMAFRGDSFYYQISDGRMIKVNAQGIRFLLNGQEDVLFESGSVEALNHEDLRKEINRFSSMETLPNEWYETLKEARIADSPNDFSRFLLSLLYSISPWMYRWRATQLPLEQMLGEAGSGKSTLYKLRQTIIEGRSSLRNAPKDLRDWTASVASSGALHVTDNVHMGGGMLKQQLSDELCRVITEDHPHIEARKLYSDNELIRVPVQTVFAVTAIKQPFTNTDIIQRSIITQLDKGTSIVDYDADWVGKHLERLGGRTSWVAYQLVFLHRLMQRVTKEWNPTYKARFRLINVEQLMILGAKVYGMDYSWIQDYLERTRDELTAKSDQVLEGLIIWAEKMRERFSPKALANTSWTASEIITWFEGEEEWEENPILNNSRKLGNYLVTNQNTVSQITGIVPHNTRNNSKTYKVTSMDDD